MITRMSHNQQLKIVMFQVTTQKIKKLFCCIDFRSRRKSTPVWFALIIEKLNKD